MTRFDDLTESMRSGQFDRDWDRELEHGFDEMMRYNSEHTDTADDLGPDLFIQLVRESGDDVFTKDAIREYAMSVINDSYLEYEQQREGITAEESKLLVERWLDFSIELSEEELKSIRRAHVLLGVPYYVHTKLSRQFIDNVYAQSRFLKTPPKETFAWIDAMMDFPQWLLAIKVRGGEVAGDIGLEAEGGKKDEAKAEEQTSGDKAEE